MRRRSGPRGRLGPAPARAAILAAMLLCLGLAGCGTILRLPPPPPEEAVGFPVLGIANARFWPDGPPDALIREGLLMAERQRSALPRSTLPPGQRRLPPAHFLALSGGGDYGAYGAGVLLGWTEAGTRPEFAIVTGISAGALIAPFAFLGPGYDDELREVFTEVAPRDVLRLRRLLPALLFNEALADTSPLYRLIERYADQRMLEAIAAEYARGRLLLVGTTNLDVQRPVVWNIGAIAASGHPEALTLFRRILLASAAIPGAFPPVLVDLDEAGRRFQEMHVDGGAATQVFLYPPTVNLGAVAAERGHARERTVHVIRNARVDVEADAIERGIFSIARRSVATLLHFSGIGDIGLIYLAARRDGLGFRLSFIGPDFDAPRPEPFDQDFMRALFAYGRAKGRSGEAGWSSAPPIVGIRPGAPEAPPPAVSAGAAAGSRAPGRR